jgi:hypothetical protein
MHINKTIIFMLFKKLYYRLLRKDAVRGYLGVSGKENGDCHTMHVHTRMHTATVSRFTVLQNKKECSEKKKKRKKNTVQNWQNHETVWNCLKHRAFSRGNWKPAVPQVLKHQKSLPLYTYADHFDLKLRPIENFPSF